MKIFRHIFVVLLLLFISTTATAQSQSDNTDGNTTTAVRADVNGDGVVNEADIAEIIAIIKENNDVKYYWYIGQEKLTTDAEVESKGTQISKASEITNPLTWTSSNYVYFIYPVEFGTAKIVDEGGDNAGGKAIESLSDVSFTKYKGWRFNKDNQGIKYTVTFSK